MRLLHILSQRPGRTGSGVTLEALIRAAAAAQFEQFVVVGVPQEEADALAAGTMRLASLDPQALFPLAFESDALPFAVPGMSDAMPYPSTVFSQMSSAMWRAYDEAWRVHLTAVLSQTRPHVVHVHHLWKVAALLADVIDALVTTGALAARPQVVVHSHATGLRQWKQHPHLGAPLRDRLARHAHVLALHAEHRQTIVDVLGVPADAVTVVGAGFDPGVFNGDATKRSATATGDVVYAGKISAAKGLPQLLDAMDARKARGEPTQLTVCGGGDDATARLLLERMNAMENVYVRGAVTQTELAAAFRQARVFVLPSLYEGLPLVVAEAVACGCRAVVTALPGVVSTLAPVLDDALVLLPVPKREGVDGLTAASAAEFARAIDQKIGEASAHGPLEDGPERAAPFTWDAVAALVVPLWRRLAAATVEVD